MEKIVIQENHKNCPGIFYFPGPQKLEISGRSIPENPEQVYTRLLEWLDVYFKDNNFLKVDIFLEYINSGSSKYLLNVLQKMTGFMAIGKDISIKWLYEEDDEGMLELGEHYRDAAGIAMRIEMVI